MRGDERLDHRLAAIALAYGERVGLDLFQQAKALQVFHHAAAGLKAVQARVGTGFGGHAAVLVDDLDARQIVALAGFEIVRIVGRGDLDCAGAELGVGEVVENHGELAIHQRQIHGAAVQVKVARVLGVHGDGGVAQHGFGAGGGYDDKAGAG